MATLSDVKVGSDVKIKKIHGAGPIKKRIMDMGLTRGQMVHIQKVAPLGDPIEITVRNYELSLRKEDAKMVEVE
jgi:ferrous iron transport protein A